jgi:arylsulfatase A-like enzyme
MYPVLYDREIRHTDAQLERLFDRLSEAGQLENTIVVVTADHGEAFLEHDYIGHGSDVHEETTHVPLYFVGPGIEAGRRIDVPVGLIDLMPTLLDLVGVALPDATLMGRSLAPLLRGADDGAALARRPIVSEAWHPTASGRRGAEAIVPPTLAVRRGPHKLIRYKGPEGARYAFYDLSSDPREQRDRFAEGGAEVDALRAIADAYEAQSAALAARLGLPPLVTEAPDVEDMDPQRLEALRALGYVE